MRPCAHLPRHRTPHKNVVVEPGADDDSLGGAVFDGHNASGVTLHDTFALYPGQQQRRMSDIPSMIRVSASDGGEECGARV